MQKLYHIPGLIDFVYDSMDSNYFYNDYFLDRAILCTKNIDRLNNDILNKLTFTIDYWLLNKYETGG